jgi:hypothetical protein
MAPAINPEELHPADVGMLYRLYRVLPHARLKGGAPLCELSDVRAWLLQLALQADPDGKYIPREVWGLSDAEAYRGTLATGTGR